MPRKPDGVHPHARKKVEYRANQVDENGDIQDVRFFDTSDEARECVQSSDIYNDVEKMVSWWHKGELQHREHETIDANGGA